MSGLILCRTRRDERRLSSPLPAGATSFVINEGTLNYQNGDHLFITNSDGSYTQWLGSAQNVTGNSLQFTRPLMQAIPDATLWSADQIITTSARMQYPIRHTTQPGLEHLHDLDGNQYAIEVSAPRESLTLKLCPLPPHEVARIINWIETATANGCHPFTIINPGAAPAIKNTSGELTAVQLNEQPITQTAKNSSRQTIELPLTLIEQGDFR